MPEPLAPISQNPKVELGSGMVSGWPDVELTLVGSCIWV